jgi:hypothetical protein
MQWNAAVLFLEQRLGKVLFRQIGHCEKKEPETSCERREAAKNEPCRPGLYYVQVFDKYDLMCTY